MSNKATAESSTPETAVYEIIINASRVKGENSNGEYNFLAYAGYDKRGKKCKFKFTKDCPNVPKKEGIFKCVIPMTSINRDKSSRYNDFWIREVTSFEIYDGKKDNTEDLPF